VREKKEECCGFSDCRYVFCLAHATTSEGEVGEVVAALEVSSMIAKKNLFGSELERYVPLLQHYIARFPVGVWNRVLLVFSLTLRSFAWVC
jgi:hypothetical protein